LTNCGAITAGSTTTTIIFGDNSGNAGCDYSAKAASYSAWRNHRLAATDTVYAYIYDLGTGHGEIFVYTAESVTVSQYRITRASGTWQYNYPIGSAIYLIEEWRFRRFNDVVTPNLLQLIENQDVANPKNVAFSVTRLDVAAVKSDGTVLNSYVPDTVNPWSDLAAIRISLTGEENYKNKLISKVVTGEYFPRNILSH
jgi:hypothetical protein